jgi:nicotinamide mononucleotide transporter
MFGIISGFLHQKYTSNASFPYLDATLTGSSIWGTWLAANKKIENWWVWILADLIYIGMYFQKDLYVTGCLYLIFVVFAIQGLISWKKKMS